VNEFTPVFPANNSHKINKSVTHGGGGLLTKMVRALCEGSENSGKWDCQRFFLVQLKVGFLRIFDALVVTGRVTLGQ
jgi:hypothetical protein